MKVIPLVMLFLALMAPVTWAQDDACLGPQPQPDYCAQPEGSWSRGFLKEIDAAGKREPPHPERSVWDSKAFRVGIAILTCTLVLGFIIELIKGLFAFIDYRDHKKAKLIAYYIRNGT